MKHTEETKKKISESRKGQPAWNKGTKQKNFEPKKCKLCGNIFEKNKHMNARRWFAREFCSIQCSKINTTETPPKKCETCSEIFYKNKYTTFKKWPHRKFCSSKCSLAKAQKDRIGTKLSKEWCEKLSKAHMGQESWNKGTKTKLNCFFCKKDFYPRNGKIKNVKFCSLQCSGKSQRFKSRYANRGENHHNWKGGVTNENEKIRRSVEYKKWRYEVLERDEHKCVNCGSEENIWVDHIKPFHLYVDLRFDVNNGRALCRDCDKEIGWSLFKDDNPQKRQVQKVS